jgi:hypothetical protein
MKIAKVLLVLAALCTLFVTTAQADEIIDWNRNLFEAARLNVPPTSALAVTRNAALVQSAVFDAVNGIDRRFTPVHVDPAAPEGASKRAAAVQAAYAMLIRLYPSQTVNLSAKRADSLAAIGDSQPSIDLGIAWGQTVADAIWNWRLTDGITPAPPAFLGGGNVGQWRPTPPGFLSGAGVQFSYMTPWVIASPSQFRPAGPPALTSDLYAAEFNETRTMGSLNSLIRTDDQTLLSRFWNVSTASAYWNQIANSLADKRHFSFSKRARLLALLNLAVADAGIGCFEAKYTYVFWRPVTAIPLGDTDGNPDTTEDLSFTTLLTTPNHPEYPSGHSCLSGAAGEILTLIFGKNAKLTVNSDAPEMAGIVRSYHGFSEILEEIKDARVFAGIHFRSACNAGQQFGSGVADYVKANALQRVPPGRDDDEDN